MPAQADPVWLEVEARFTDSQGNILQAPDGDTAWYAVRRRRANLRDLDDGALAALTARARRGISEPSDT